VSAAARHAHARPRVLMLVDNVNEESGGAERFAIGLAAALPAQRCDVWVCTTRVARGPLIAVLGDAGVRHLHLGRRPGHLDPLAFRPLARTLRGQHIDVLHAHMFGSNVWGTLIGRLCRVPVVVANETTWSYQGNRLRRALDGQLIGRFADAFVAVSEADRARMVGIERVPHAKTVVIPTAYLPRPPAAAGAGVRAELGLGPGDPVIGTIAILRPQKALHVLVDAFAQVVRSLPRAHLVIAGPSPGPVRGELELQARAAGLEDRVHLLGQRDDIEEVWRAFDVGAISSDFEGTPLAAIECLTCGIPLVATAVGGLPEIIEHDRSGVLVAAGDPAALAAALEGLLRDPHRRERLGAAGSERAQAFTIERIAARFAQLYRRLLAAGDGDAMPTAGAP
jgi:glycosyltransferase involved in cell wall biosynthesis